MPNIGLLANINPTAASGSSPSNMIKLGSIVLFGANDGTNGTELWKSDGTAAGTSMVKNINTSGSSSPNNFVLMGGFVYFTANDGTNGGALWRTDGTLAGTTLVKDVNTTSTTSTPFIWQLTAIGSNLYFRGNDGSNGEEPWISDGTAGGTMMLKSIRPSSDGSSNEGGLSTGCFGTYEFVEFNGFVYFNANDGANSGQNSELWRTDGTNAGTVLFKDNYSFGGGGPGNLVNAGTFLFFTSDNQSLTGAEPWKSDGTVGGTVMIKDIFNPGFNVGSITGDVPTAYMNGYVYFSAIDVYDANNFNLMPPQSGYINAELWRTDGTNGNTTKVKEINPVTTGTTADAFPNNFYVFNNKLYFSATDGTNGTEVYVTDGTSAGTIMLANIDAAGNSNPSEFFAFSGHVYFSADDNAANGRELWRTDGTVANTALVKDINPGGTPNGSPADMVLLDANHVLLRATHAVTGSELFIMGGYKIAVTTGANGITTLPGAGSAGTTVDVGAKSGSNHTFTFTPDPTFSVQSLTVDGAGAGTPSSYTFNNVIANHTLSVTFGTGGPPPCPTITFSATPTNTCPSSSNGQIAVSGVMGGTGPYMYSKDNGSNYQSGATFTGLAAATYQVVVKDANNCTSGATPVIVGSSDGQAPMITCPANATVSANASCQGQIGAYSAATLSDNCNPNPSVTQSPVSSSLLTGHNATQIVTLTANDGNGNTGTCTLTVTLKDVTPPNITCPANTTVAANASCQGQIGSYNAATLSDNCNPTPIVTQSPPSTTTLTGHNTVQTVTLTANDGNGNTNTCTLTVTLKDVTPPSITCPANATVSANASCQGQIGSYSAATLSDNCNPNPSVTQSPASSTLLTGHNATQTVTLTANDGNGNTGTCTLTVTLKDVTPPNITCPANTTVNANASCQGQVGSYTAATLSDNCNPTPIVTQSPPSTTTLTGHNTVQTVTLTADDGNGNTNTCTLTVTLTDVTPPNITCPANATVSANASCQGQIGSYSAATLSDNCNPSSTVTQSPASSTVITGHNGTQTVTLTANDGNGNTGTCTLTVTLKDVTPPDITCPGPVTVTCSSQVPAANLADVTATDNCGTPTKSHDGDATTNMTCTSRKTVTRTYSVDDGNGNTATCTQVITVFDNVAPVLSAVPANVTVQCNALPAVGSPTATDGCGGSVTVSYNGQSTTPGTCADTYTLTRQWTATDGCGNTKTAVQVITVRDTQLPNFTSTPANVTVQCNAVPAVGTPVATDNCDPMVAISYIGQTTTAGTCPNNYTLIRRWVASDNCNNTRSISQSIVVRDNTKPVFTFVPADQTISCADTEPAVGTPTATDGCSGVVTITYLGQTTASGSCATSYQLRRTWRATDVCGNTTAATQVIQVNDNVAPTFVTVPAPVTIQCNTPLPALVHPTASDGCGGYAFVTFLGQVASGSGCTADYTVTRTWKAEDLCFNSATTVQVITVLGTSYGPQGTENRAQEIGRPLQDGRPQGSPLREIVVSPNPTSDRVWVDLSDFAGEAVTVSIFGDLGQLVWERAIPALREQKLSVSLREAGAAAGIYTLGVRSASGVVATRVVLVE